jgi:hypothetical protein
MKANQEATATVEKDGVVWSAKLVGERVEIARDGVKVSEGRWDPRGRIYEDTHVPEIPNYVFARLESELEAAS